MLNAQRAQVLPPRKLPAPSSNSVVPVARAKGFESRLDEALDDIGAWDDEIAEEIGMPLHDGAPPTPEQITRLKELGATEGQLSHLKTRSDAIRLIEVLQPPPTEEQFSLLRTYGVTEEELSFLTTEGVAQAMIEEYESDSGCTEYESEY